MALKMFKAEARPPLSNITHVVGVAAGKGGVGKSSVTANLALALKRAGYAVGVMDTDIYGPSMRRMLPEDQPPSQKGDMIIPAMCHGIRMISMAYFRPKHSATAVRAPIANGMIVQFINNVDWGPLDFLLIDFPPGTGDIQLTLSQRANLSGVLMVTTPQEVAVMDVRKAVDLFEQVRVPIVGVVENMSYYYHAATDEKLYLFGQGGGERLAQEIGAPFLGSIPIDPIICRCGDEGKVLFAETAAQAPAVIAFEELAKALVAHMAALKRKASDNLSDIDLVWKEMS